MDTRTFSKGKLTPSWCSPSHTLFAGGSGSAGTVAGELWYAAVTETADGSTVAVLAKSSSEKTKQKEKPLGRGCD